MVEASGRRAIGFAAGCAGEVVRRSTSPLVARRQLTSAWAARVSRIVLLYSASSRMAAGAPGITACSAASGGSVLAAAGNPLLDNSMFPRWDAVAAQHVVPGMIEAIAEAEASLGKLEEAARTDPDIVDLTAGLEQVGDRVGRCWGIVNHLKATKDTQKLRDAVEEVQPEVVRFNLRMSSSRAIYEGFRSIAEDDTKMSSLTNAQKRIVESQLLQAKLSGVALEGDQRVRFDEITQRLDQLATSFSNNLLDATKAFSVELKDTEQVAGLPETARALMAQTAKENGHDQATPEEGPWVVTLARSSYEAVLTYANDRSLREKIYRAYLSRASEFSENKAIDNTPLIEEILKLRQERAEILGMSSHADLSCATKMASPDQALQLLERLRVSSFDQAKAEKEELQKFATSLGFDGELRQWDVGFYAEKLLKSKYDFNQEELKPYFSLEKVLQGLFALVSRLFDVVIVPADSEDAPTWHKDVQLFRVQRDNDRSSTMAYFYVDPYARPEEKRDGAWMDEVLGRSRTLAPAGLPYRYPVAHMVCNGSPPVGDKPSLMTFREVETIFHEAGHCLQHLLTQEDEGLVAGIRGVEWDAVEIASQFMENWCLDKPTVDKMAVHYKTGERIPDELFQKMLRSKNYRSASGVLRQLLFSVVDLEVHSGQFDPSKESVFDVYKRVAKTCSVSEPLEEDRFLCGFAHIFAGGYSAGYYSYKWAEVLSADCFAAFEEAGLGDEDAVKATGRRYADTILARGGGQAPSEVFEAFRGRAPSPEAFLRHNGLVTQ